jgi:hypothetical protein
LFNILRNNYQELYAEEEYIFIYVYIASLLKNIREGKTVENRRILKAVNASEQTDT